MKNKTLPKILALAVLELITFCGIITMAADTGAVDVLKDRVTKKFIKRINTGPNLKISFTPSSLANDISLQVNILNKIETALDTIQAPIRLPDKKELNERLLQDEPVETILITDGKDEEAPYIPYIKTSFFGDAYQIKIPANSTVTEIIYPLTKSIFQEGEVMEEFRVNLKKGDALRNLKMASFIRENTLEVTMDQFHLLQKIINKARESDIYKSLKKYGELKGHSSFLNSSNTYYEIDLGSSLSRSGLATFVRVSVDTSQTFGQKHQRACAGQAEFIFSVGDKEQKSFSRIAEFIVDERCRLVEAKLFHFNFKKPRLSYGGFAVQHISKLDLDSPKQISVNTVDTNPVVQQQQSSVTIPGEDFSFDVKYASQTDEVRVCILDSGIDYNHPAIQWRLSSLSNIGYDTLDQDELPNDENGHGTHVAGIATQGSRKIKAFPVKLMGMGEQEQLIDFDNDSNWDAKILRDALEICRKNGAKIVNMSFGGGYSPIAEMLGRGSSKKDVKAINKEIRIYKSLFQEFSDLLFVVAAGNDSVSLNEHPQFPAGIQLPNVMTVGSVNGLTGHPSEFSNYGQPVDVLAAGEDVLSVKAGGQFVEYSGTSMATPQVVNAAAKLALIMGEMNPALIKNLILASGYKSDKYVGLCSSAARLNLEGAIEQAKLMRVK